MFATKYIVDIYLAFERKSVTASSLNSIVNLLRQFKECFDIKIKTIW